MPSPEGVISVRVPVGDGRALVVFNSMGQTVVVEGVKCEKRGTTVMRDGEGRMKKAEAG